VRQKSKLVVAFNGMKINFAKVGKPAILYPVPILTSQDFYSAIPGKLLFYDKFLILAQ